MERALITGSSDGLGLMAARLLVEDGHGVTLHARSDVRAADPCATLPPAEQVIVGDASTEQHVATERSISTVGAE